MRLLIAEKPSVARDLARVLGATQRRDGWFEGSDLRVSWCFGHMCELQEPAHYDAGWRTWSFATLPMIPEAFALKVRKGAVDQFKVLQKLMRAKEVEQVVNCCDAGREGELIFRYVYEQAGCTKPVQRLWVSSLTDEAIRAGWNKLRPGADFDDLADAARSRSEADWLVGLNATRAFTCKTRESGPGALLSLGRVQTPTLAMIVARDLEIEAFVPETFWRIAATFEADVEHPPNRWTAFWFRPEVKETDARDEDGGDEEDGSHAERLSTLEDAELVAAATRGGLGRIEKASRKKKVEKPPLLYDLTALQRRANQRYGLSAQRTLEIAQALYEKHKLITYPRTDARYLTPDQVPGLADVVRGLMPIGPYATHCQAVLAKPIKPGKRVVNAAEVGDHHAILPTGKTPGQGLNPDEKRVFDLVARRLLAALSDDALFDLTELITAVDPMAPLPEGVSAPLRFRARGKICRQQGWRSVDPPGASKDVELPAVDVGDEAPVAEVEAREGKTRPPRPHTDASILRAMETAGKTLDDDELARAMRSRGLGTPATRAAILQTLLDRKYVRRDARALVATEKGRELVAALPVDVLKSAELTGRWEGRLTDMAEGKAARADFMRDAAVFTAEVVDAIRAAPAPQVAADPGREPSKPLGACPVCGQPVRARGAVFTCDTGRSCPFVVFGTMSKRSISAQMVRQLLKDGRTNTVKGFKSKAGKPFEAALEWDAEKQRVGFAFEDAPSGPRVGDPCPKCRVGSLIQGRTTVGCNRWREGCDYRA